MKVLIISKSLPASFKGGIQTHVWELSGHLIAAGIKISILTGGSYWQKKKRKQIEGRETIYLPFIPWRKFPWFGMIFEELAFNLAVVRWVWANHKKYDVIHIQGRSGYLVPLLKLKTPIVNTVHRLWSVEGKWTDKDFNNKLEAKIYSKLTCFFEENAIRKSSKVIGVSRSTITEILDKIKVDPKNVNLIYNGANPKLGFPTSKPVKNQLLFVGRLCAIKGIFPLIEALAAFNFPGKLIMVGDGPAQTELMNLIESKGLSKKVQLIGSQEQEVVRQLMRESYALILPSFHESQGIVLLENNIEGRPVLASDIAGIKEVVFHQQNGLLFPTNSVKGMISAIQELYSDPEKATAMGRRGREIVKTHFNWEKIAQQTIQIYAKL